MTIWILALILLGACMALGHKLGAIRAAATFIGIIISALLASPLSGFIRPLLSHVIHNPIWLWALPPFIVFVILLCIFKGIGQLVHRKVFVHYKHYTDELQMSWWERMIHRVGLCVGALNALAYLVLLASVIYVFGYWTAQIATSDEENFSVRLLNRAGHDLEATGMIKVARAVEPLSLPPLYFELADLAGLLYQNPQLADRLADYPAFLSLGQRDEFQNLSQDTDFQSAWQSHRPIGNLLGDDNARAIWLNKDNAGLVWNLVATNLDDLQNYLQTGNSEKYDSNPVLGRWHFNVVSTIAMMGQSQPTFSGADMRALRALWTPAYAKTVLIVSSDGQAFLKNWPRFKPPQPKQPPQYDMTSYSGEWSGDGENFQFNLANDSDKINATAKVSSARLTLTMDGGTKIFDK